MNGVWTGLWFIGLIGLVLSILLGANGFTKRIGSRMAYATFGALASGLVVLAALIGSGGG